MTTDTIVTIVSVVISVIGGVWYLARKLATVDHRLGRQGQTLNGLLGLMGQLIQIMHSRATLNDDEFKQLISSYTEMARVPTHASPLAPAEKQRLDSYLAKAHRGDFFSAEEVEDYNNLVAKLEREKKNDPGVWPLVALGAFLFGLFVASRKKP